MDIRQLPDTPYQFAVSPSLPSPQPPFHPLVTSFHFFFLLTYNQTTNIVHLSFGNTCLDCIKNVLGLSLRTAQQQRKQVGQMEFQREHTGREESIMNCYLHQNFECKYPCNTIVKVPDNLNKLKKHGLRTTKLLIRNKQGVGRTGTRQQREKVGMKLKCLSAILFLH